MRKSILFSSAAAVLLSAATARAGEPPKKTADLVAKGKASYEVNCASCHGAAGRGDGEVGAALDPKPRDLVAGTFRNGVKAAQVYATLEKGIDGTTMVSYGHLPEDERWALTYYVLELRGAKAKK